MSDSDVPPSQAGGRRIVSAELPEKLRVHALAKLISVPSRQVLDTLAKLGAPARGVMSSIDRESAQRVIDSLGTTPSEDAPEPTPAIPLPLFTVPSPMFLPPDPASVPAAVRVPAKPPVPAPSADDDADESGVDDDSVAEYEDGAADDGGDSRRRRRRGRRGRGRGRGSDDDGSVGDGSVGDGSVGDEEDAEERESDSDLDAEQDGDDGEDVVEGEAGSSSSRRRRRRRRRKDSSDIDIGDGGDASGTRDDPPNTVTRVREPRPPRGEGKGDSGDEGIQGVRGSTRLEAKRQRRRDGRDAGRRRAPVLSEAEFLARRESVERTMVVRQHGERSEIGVLEDGVLVEHFVTSSGGTSLVGNVYLGRVQNVLPSMEAAFVDIGRGRNAVLYAGEVDWDAAGLAGKARRIEQALSSGDSILVQVTKDPVGHKGARLTTQLSLPGRFLVYVPAGGTHGISRKLADTERRRLKDLLKEIVPDDAGVIIRTASEGVSQEALERDVRRLQAQWEVVRTRSEAAKTGKSKAPDLLYEEPDLMIKVVRDQFNEDFSKLVVAGDDAWDTLQAYVGHVAPELTERLHRHVGTTDVFSEYRIDEQLLKALDRKVWLPSGGTLVIDRTEAMTVVDVNTGKFTGTGGNLEETVTRNNLEAAEEIVRQMRLRDIGGIIVIDFIDMVLESNRDLVLRRLTECLGRDRTRHQVAEVTSLGLVQMTRKRVGVGLLEAFSNPCEYCRGRGVVVSADPVESRADSGPQQSSGGGRRRGRSDNGGDGGGNGNGGGRRRGGGNGAANGVERVAAASPNGSPVTGEVSRAPVPAEPVSSSEPAAVTEPAVTEPAVAPRSPVVPESPVVQVTPAVTGASAVTGAPVVTGAVVPAARSSAASELSTEDELSQPDESPASVSFGSVPGESARPARRRRVASRPAGPPAGEDPV